MANEKALEAAFTLMDVADYLKDALDNGKPIYESKWLDALMEVHGVLSEIADASS